MSPTHHRRVRSFLSHLLHLGLLGSALGADALAAPPSDPPRAELHGLIENVIQANARRYGTTDSTGQFMDTANLIQDPAGGNMDNALLYWGVGGNIGDRDATSYKGYAYGLMEGSTPRMTSAPGVRSSMTTRRATPSR